MSTLPRLWLWATAIGLTLLATWAFAPVLIFLLLLVAALGFVAAAMIYLARRLPRCIDWLRRALDRIAAGFLAFARRLRAGRR